MTSSDRYRMSDIPAASITAFCFGVLVNPRKEPMKERMVSGLPPCFSSVRCAAIYERSCSGENIALPNNIPSIGIRPDQMIPQLG